MILPRLTQQPSDRVYGCLESYSITIKSHVTNQIQLMDHPPNPSNWPDGNLKTWFNPMDPTMAQDKILKTNRSSARLAKILLCEPEVAREPVFVARGMFS